jgi:hypothetical protein
LTNFLNNPSYENKNPQLINLRDVHRLLVTRWNIWLCYDYGRKCMNESEEKYTIETDFGLGGEKKKLTFYRCLRGNKHAEEALKSLGKASVDLSFVLDGVRQKHPEYYNEILKDIQTINRFRIELHRQLCGYISY